MQNLINKLVQAFNQYSDSQTAVVDARDARDAALTALTAKETALEIAVANEASLKDQIKSHIVVLANALGIDIEEIEVAQDASEGGGNGDSNPPRAQRPQQVAPGAGVGPVGNVQSPLS